MTKTQTRSLEELNREFDQSHQAERAKKAKQDRLVRRAIEHRRRIRARHKAVANGPAMAGHKKLDREFDDRLARDRS
jgi:hypothetical protein